MRTRESDQTPKKGPLFYTLWTVVVLAVVAGIYFAVKWAI